MIGTGHAAIVCAAVFGGAACAAVVAQPERAVLALMVAVPFLVYPVSAGGLSIFLGLPLGLLIGVALLLRSSAAAEQRRPVLPAFAFGAFLTIGAFSAAISAHPTTAASRLLYLVMFGLLAASLAQAMARGLIAPRRLVEALVAGAALAAIAVIGQTLAQFVVGRDSVVNWLVSVSSTFGGAHSAGIGQVANWYVPSIHMVRGVLPFMAAPSAGQYLMLGLVGAVWLRRRPPRRAVAFRWESVVLALLAVGLVATLSRQAWLGAFVGLVMLTRERGRIRSIVTVVCLALVVALLPVPDGSGRTFGDYLLSSGDTQTKSTAQRIGLWRQAIDATQKRPVLGVGPGLVSTLNPDTNNKVFYAHNVVLDAAVETGIPGAIAFVALVLGGLALAWRNGSRIALGLIAAYAVANMFDDVLYFPRNGTFIAAAFALAALPAAAAASRRRLAAPAKAMTAAPAGPGAPSGGLAAISVGAGRSRGLAAPPIWAAPSAGLVVPALASPHSAAAPEKPIAAPVELAAAAQAEPTPVAVRHPPEPASPAPAPPQVAPAAPARVKPLVLGKGWFPDQEGGLNRYLRNLLDALGHPPAVVVGPALDAPRTVSAKSIHDGPLSRRVLGFTAATLRRARKADVVDAHFALYAFLPTLLGLRGKPLVIHFHGPWGDESIAAGRATRPKAAAQRAVERAVFRHASAAIVLSNAFKELLVKRYRFDPEIVHVVRPGVDLARFSPGDRETARRGLGLPADRRVAVTARRLVPRMGIDVLLDAWSRLGSATDRPLLLVVGDGQQRTELEAQARTLRIEKDVRFLGKVSDDDLVAAYRAADVAVAPSTALEGFGLVTLEALACGTPVIASRVGGLPEALDPLDPSLVVSPKDAKVLAKRLQQAFDGERPLPSRERCRAYAEGFTWQRTAREVEAVYRAAVAAAAAPAPAAGASTGRRVTR